LGAVAHARRILVQKPGKEGKKGRREKGMISSLLIYLLNACEQ
jgi:hypothetical protein